MTDKHNLNPVGNVRHGKKSAIQALSAAAITLPGLASTVALAVEEEVSFSYGHYQEGNRRLYGATSAFSPIEVDSLQGSGKWKLTDRIKFAFNYTQDTWGGATPIATAPLAFGGNGRVTRTNHSDTNVGATPYLTNSTIFFDQNFKPVEEIQIDDKGGKKYTRDDRLVHTLSQASPETRKQGDFKLTYEWDNAAVDIGGGISVEDDYESRFGSVNTRWDFNQKQTTVNAGLSYTNSDTHAVMDHDAQPYFITDANYDPLTIDRNNNGANTLTGNRQDWSVALGLSQVLSKSTLLETGLGYTRSTGYMENPYKAVSIAFVDPLRQNNSDCPQGLQGLLCGSLNSLLEQRPDERNQWNGSIRFVQYIEPFDASMHFGYRIFSDDWGITSHTFDADWAQPLASGWTVTPRVRYYSQSKADFYTPMLITRQAFSTPVTDSNGFPIYVDKNGTEITNRTNPDLAFLGTIWFDAQGNDITHLVNSGKISIDNFQQKVKSFDRAKLPANFSSDQRLSGYGALSGGVTVSKQFSKGVNLDLGFEYYTHQGGLKLGHGAEDGFADFNYWTANAALRVDLEAMSLHANAGGNGHQHHHAEHGVHGPAGVMFDHMLPKAGDMMLGYRYMYSSQSGNILHGTLAKADNTIINKGCGPVPCVLTSANMAMHMHMLDLMYAPTDWLTLMLMPQFMDMDMNMRALANAPLASSIYGDTNLDDHVTHHLQNGHETGGIGDLGMYALVKLFDNHEHHVHVTAGFSAPTGDVDIQLRPNHKLPGGFIHYGMQLGSGTWDFKPSLTYTGRKDRFSWGGQVNGTYRMEDANKSGYALGNIFQATGWGSFDLTDWLTATIRGVHTRQGPLKRQFNGLIYKFGPQDYSENHGGKYWDIGFGLSAVVPSGDLAGNRVSVEWLQPVQDNVRGYQLERDGTLSATWSLAF